ncbi:hypothetical protein D3C87_2014100 [compost metagenome]
MALVDSEMSWMPGKEEMRATRPGKSLRTRGSPPVRRILVTPSGRNTSRTRVSIS